ncbi:MAG: hypothetical protein JW929_00510 [Anaerolineales bacterium]|nr:hypothetical protein [Anaerolineales bacterium]
MQVEFEYFLLYYQFIKHAFGLEFAPGPIRMRLYFDTFPDTEEKTAQFKGYLLGLTKTKRWRTVDIQREDITEVRTRNHVLLQCLDIVFGSMSFRLNDKHKEKLADSSRRRKRTIAKEQLYRFILAEIGKIHPRFNIGISTSLHGDANRQWSDPYLHWNFVPADGVFESTLTKPRRKGKKENPI